MEKLPGEREIIIVNKELKDLLQDKAKIVEEGRKLNVDLEKLQEKLNKKAAKIQKYNEKIQPMVRELLYPQLEEHEELANIDIKDQKLVVTAYDKIEEFRQNFAESKKKALGSEEDKKEEK